MSEVETPPTSTEAVDMVVNAGNQPKSDPATPDMPDATEAPVEAAETDEKAEKVARTRNFSFLHKKPDTLDEVEINGKIFKVPAAAGSCYWAILKVFYENHDKPIYPDDLIKMVAEMMEDRDERAWQIYINKSKTTVHKNVDGAETRVVQPIRTWQERVINNTKTLTRSGGNSPYGLRLIERGHALRGDYDSNGKPYFILYTDLESLKQKEKATEKE